MAGTLRRFRLRNAMVCAGIGLAGALIVLALRYSGVLQGAELYAYDAFVRLRAPHAPARNDKIALIEMNEQDIEENNYPLWDTDLAALLKKVESQQPAAIGLDLYRDLPEPRHNSDGLQVLYSVLKANDNIICAFKFDNPDHPFEVPPPAILKDRLEDRIGFSDFPLDTDTVDTGTARRAWLGFSDPKGNTYTSFAFLLAFAGGLVNPGNADNGLTTLGGAPIYKFTSDTGGYVNAKDGGYQFLLDFKGPQTFTSYSLDDVLENKIPRNAFAGKTVLIGENNTSVNDALSTPLRYDEPGVELHATVVDQLMRMDGKGDRVMQAWGWRAQAGWLILWCAIAANIGYYCRAPLAFTTAAIGMVLVLFYCCWRAFEAGWWIPLVPPLAGSLPVTAMVVSYMGYREKMDRGILMSIFKRHVDEGVAEEIWEHRESFMRGQRLIPQRLVATVLFTDLQNFSTVSETMEPEKLLAWINEYMDKLVKHVAHYDGMVNKYMGDSIMVVFGAPVPSTSEEKINRDALNAVKCALAMGNSLDELNILRRAEGRPTTNMRVGIYTGPAVAGSIGGCDRFEFTVLGDTVNTASRLESFDKACFSEQTCRILIGETTAERVKSYFRLKFINTIELKGQREKTDIYYVSRDENCEEGVIDRGDGRADLSGGLPGTGELTGSNPAANATLESARSDR